MAEADRVEWPGQWVARRLRDQRLGRIGERGPRAWWLGQNGARGRQDEEREGGAGAAQQPG